MTQPTDDMAGTQMRIRLNPQSLSLPGCQARAAGRVQTHDANAASACFAGDGLVVASRCRAHITVILSAPSACPEDPRCPFPGHMRYIRPRTRPEVTKRQSFHSTALSGPDVRTSHRLPPASTLCSRVPLARCPQLFVGFGWLLGL